MPFICMTCNTEYSSTTGCPTCLNKPLVCPDCGHAYVQIRHYRNGDRLFIHELHFQYLRVPRNKEELTTKPFAHMMIDECCYVKGDKS